MTDRRRAPVLVLGLGNPYWGDDGVGQAALEALSCRSLPPGVEIRDGGTGGLLLLDVIADREHLLVIDAGDFGEAPGTVRDFSPEEAGLCRADRPLSFHQAGLAEVLEIARKLGMAPRNVHLWVVQPGRLGPGCGLSAPVQAALPGLVDSVCRALGALLPEAARV